MKKMLRSSVSLVALGCSALVTGFVAIDTAPTGASAAPPHVAQSAPMGPMCISPSGRLLAQAKEVGPAAPRNPAATVGEVPLWSNLGTLTYPVSTNSPRAQNYFNQGLRLAYGFNHAEAQRAFRKAQELDPDCAMCHWGEALVLGPNINAPMESDAVAPAFAAVQRARSASRASPKERALIAALATRYSADANADRAALDLAYAEAMQRVAAQYPDDMEISTLYAEALMDLQPWDYWEADGTTPKGRAYGIVSTLERVLAINPNHPGAIHYYIHAVEASNRPQRAEPYADRLAALMPGAGHIVHMPSHIYFRVGRYLDSLKANQEAVAVDETYIAQVQAGPGMYTLGYYPHNIHFVVVSAQMAGDGPTVIAAADKLARTIPDDAARAIPMVQPIKAAPLFAHAQFSTPDTILALPAPGAGLPYLTAMWHYARGVALAAQGNAAAARDESYAIARLAKAPEIAALTQAAIPADNVLALAYHVVLARIAQAQGDHSAAVAEFEKAAAIEDTLPYMEPAYWYYPVRQSLGAALLKAGKPEAAEAAFKASLQQVPQNAWALYGLAEAHKARGDNLAADAAMSSLGRGWIGDRKLLSLERL